MTPCAGSDAFRFSDGTMVRDLSELRHATATKSPSLVHYHKPSYHEWILRVLGDPALARKVERVSERRGLDNEGYRGELVAVLDERLGKLRTRVI